jgi:type II secretory pathway predicted ATPase ExeA
MTAAGYESIHGLVERPFSLTPDPKWFFNSRSHGRALDSLLIGLGRRDHFLLLTGDLGVGKTTICRTLIHQLRRRTALAYCANPLLSSTDLLRLLLHDFGGATSETAAAVPADGSRQRLFDALVNCLRGLARAREGPVLIVDEAHTTPAEVMDELLQLSAITIDGERVMQIVLSAQPSDSDAAANGIHRIDADIATRARILPFGREDCADYVTHRLTLAGAVGISFTPRAIDLLFGLSGGVPRLVNLLCERALQVSAADGSRKIEPATIEHAASALALLRARPKRFRWFQKRVS